MPNTHLKKKKVRKDKVILKRINKKIKEEKKRFARIKRETEDWLSGLMDRKT